MTTDTVQHQHSTLADFKEWHQKNRFSTDRSGDLWENLTSLSVTPDWFNAVPIKLLDTINAYSVPIFESLADSLPPGSTYRLLFFKAADGQIKTELVFFMPTKHYLNLHPGGFSVHDFSGATFKINESGCSGFHCLFDEGNLKGYAIEEEDFAGSIGERGENPCGDFKDTFKYKWIKFWKNVGDRQGGWLEEIFGGNEPGTTYISILPMRPGFTGQSTTQSPGSIGTSFTPEQLQSMFSNNIFSSAPLDEFQVNCGFNNTEMSSPLVTSTSKFRMPGQLSQGWPTYMLDCLNQYINNQNGYADSTFAQILANVPLATGYGNHGPLSLSPNSVEAPFIRDALLSVFTNMTNSYSMCASQMEQNNNFTGDFVFDYAAGDFCDCLNSYTINDALNELMPVALRVFEVRSLASQMGLSQTQTELLLDISSSCDPMVEEFEECLEKKISEAFFRSPDGMSPCFMPESFTNCFFPNSPGYTYEMTLFLKQPSPNSRELYTAGLSPSSSSLPLINTGHAFMSVAQFNENKVEIARLTFGWYPAEEKPNGSQQVPGQYYHENSNSVYNISVTWEIDYVQFSGLSTDLANNSPFYQAEYNNCTNAVVFAIENALGYDLPHTPRVQWPLGEITLNPADLGEDLRLNPSGGDFKSFSLPHPSPPISECK